MILVDTSVWIDHFEREIPRLIELLLDGQVTSHAFVEGELASGFLRGRTEILAFIRELPAVPVVEHADVRHLLESERLYGRGIGWIDVHLIAAARASSTRVWTHDRRLERAARHLGVAA